MAWMGWFFAGVAMVAATSAPAATLPQPGTYAANIWVGSSTSYACWDQPDAIYGGVLNYGGLGSDHAGLRVPLGNKGVVSVQTLTAKNGIGTLTPKGTFTWKVTGANGTKTTSGTWSAKIKVVDNVSFTADITEHYIGDLCTEGLVLSLTRLGPQQH